DLGAAHWSRFVDPQLLPVATSQSRFCRRTRAEFQRVVAGTKVPRRASVAQFLPAGDAEAARLAGCSGCRRHVARANGRIRLAERLPRCRPTAAAAGAGTV